MHAILVYFLLVNLALLATARSINNETPKERLIKWESVGCQIEDSTTPQIQTTLNTLDEHGYAYIPPEFYYKPSDAEYNHALSEIQASYATLKLDTYSPGNRFRAHSAFRWNSTECKFAEFDIPFFQSVTFNSVDGDKNRKFERVSKNLFNNPIFQTLLATNIEMARNSDLVEFNDSLVMQIHQIRYSPQGENPSFATPTWLHRDDEPLTFLHLVQITPNIIGGDSVIATNETYIYRVTKLTNPLATYAVNQKYFHAVTPMGKSDDNPGFRDIIIIDFMNKMTTNLVNDH